MILPHFWRRSSVPPQDYTAEAAALFTRFAERHTLTYEIVPQAPIELLWRFPPQQRLSVPVTLGLQNEDELNFGLPGLWATIFPFPAVSADFERIIDAWVEGRARLVRVGWLRTRLELNDNGGWRIVYRAFGAGGWPNTVDTLQNTPSPAR